MADDSGDNGPVSVGIVLGLLTVFSVAAGAVGSHGGSPRPAATATAEETETGNPGTRVAASSTRDVDPVTAGPVAAARRVCGPGYTTVVDSFRPVAGVETILAYDQASGTNCAFTRRAGSTARHLRVSLRYSTGTRAERHEEGPYGAYAGPVFLHAPGRCVDFGGGEAAPTTWRNRQQVGCR